MTVQWWRHGVWRQTQGSTSAEQQRRLSSYANKLIWTENTLLIADGELHLSWHTWSAMETKILVHTHGVRESQCPEPTHTRQAAINTVFTSMTQLYMHATTQLNTAVATRFCAGALTTRKQLENYKYSNYCARPPPPTDPCWTRQIFAYSELHAFRRPEGLVCGIYRIMSRSAPQTQRKW